MILNRYKPKVNRFHYDEKNDYEDYEMGFNIHITPLKVATDFQPVNSSTLGTRLDFTMMFEEFVISGSVDQVSRIQERKIESKEDLSKEEIDELLEPLFNLVKRLTYEISEISLDKPGITIEFDQIK